MTTRSDLVLARPMPVAAVLDEAGLCGESRDPTGISDLARGLLLRPATLDCSCAGRVVLRDEQSGLWLHFREPLAVVEAWTVGEIGSGLALVEQAVEEQGLYAAGFIAYEAAPAFDPALRVRCGATGLLLWFGLFEEPVAATALPDQSPPDYHLGDWRPAISRPAYRQAIACIKDHIAAGDTYQVNYTFPLRAAFHGDPWGLFLRLARAQRSSVAAYVDTGRYAVCSASPELFFRLEGRQLSSRPMKGTAPRGRTLDEDNRQRAWLYRSEKNRAENVMIVDMIRNDMGRIAAFGSVHVPRLFDVERYPTVLQMTSTVSCHTDASLTGIMAALFPCASITGAPKVRTMEIIAGLEPAPRGVYSGCIGYMAPGRRAQFNVAIRTVVVDRPAAQAVFGVGGGIVWDSEADDEYQECRVKARVLTESLPEFELLETMLWTPEEGYFLLDRHLRRLAESAEYFAIAVDLAAVRRELAALAARLASTPQRVRLLVAQDGTFRLEAAVLEPGEPAGPLRVGLAAEPVDSNDRFLYHKTTHRAVYQAARRSRPECDDVLLWNERGEITESSIANVVVRIDDELLTPPVSSGLLPGTYRDWLLFQGLVRERVITRQDLAGCRGIYLVNSVRGWREAVLV